MEKNRNYIIAIALSIVIVLAWQILYMNPRMEEQRRYQEQQQALQQANQQTQSATQPGVSGSLPGGAGSTATLTRDESIGKSQRVAIETESVIGSINLTGARLDDLRLKKYHETVDDSSPNIVLLSPSETNEGYFAEVGYLEGANAGSVPGATTEWTLAEGDKLTETTPVTLRYTNDKGVTFTRTISIDANYMISFTDKVENAGTETVTLGTYGRITRNNKPATPSVFVIHEGFIGVNGAGGTLSEEDYDDVEEATVALPKATGGWLGITDKYWAAAIIPQQDKSFETRYSHFKDGRPRYQADYKADPFTVEPGQSAQLTNLIFAGAKEVPLVDGYEEQYGIQHFDLLIDWGWFYFITKPMFKLMDFFYRYFGNFGVAILLTTIVVKLVFFPLASKQYASMAQMKRLQPKMEELKAKHGSDRMAMQQAMMQLYKEEKVNPVAGCWPMLLQIPVFFALYKVIYVTIEMRHAPFFGWIQDLSAPDPTSLFNLFGLLPFDVPAFLLIGVWPIIMGITMFLQMRMNPAPADPTQAMIFNWMPLMFTFMLASFPAGLVIYWAWNNTLSIAQQALIMKKHGAKIELIDNLVGLFKRKPAEKK